MKNYLLALTFSFLIIGCSKKDREIPQSDTVIANTAASRQSGEGVGIVTSISKDEKFVGLAHSAIPNIMEAMSMEYPVHSTFLLDSIKVGDSVRFTMAKTPQAQYEITAIHKK